MNSKLRDYFYFTKSQRRALWLISSLILLLIIFNRFAPYYFTHTLELDVEQLEAEHPAIFAKEVAIQKEAQNRKQSAPTELFAFDPNIIEQEEWQALGLSKAQAGSILKYRRKGGVFKVKEDVKKMYVVSAERYALWEPFIQLPDTLDHFKTLENKPDKKFKRPMPIVVNLNTTDSAELTKLRGIGPVYASRIIKYRQALGGFYKIDQLGEVWGLQDSTLAKLRHQLTIVETDLQKIHINQLEADQLKKHPYLSWRESNAIVNYRKQHGSFQNADDLKKIYAVGDSLINAISPYLVFD